MPVFNRPRERWVWIPILLIAAAILLVALGAKSLWVDELFTVQVAGEHDLGLLIRHCIETERRPPLHYLLLHAWMRIAGSSDVSVRLPSAFFALLSLPLLARLARGLGMGSLGLGASALLAIAPTFVLYARMTRAYSFAVALGILCTILFLDILQQPSRRAWLAYIVSAIVLLYTDYALLSLLLAQNMYVAYRALPPSSSPAALRQEGGERFGGGVRAWLISQTILAGAFVPWLVVVASHLGRAKLEADFSRGMMGYLLKLAYPVLSLSVGETIFPWHPVAVLGLICVGTLFIVGVITLSRACKRRAVFVLLFLVVPFLFAAFLLSSVATDITFINMTSRTLFAVPFFILILAAGIQALPRQAWRFVAAAIVGAAWAVALFNYYTNRDFHNPIYVVPMREIVQEIATAAQPGDIIVSDVDSGFGYYYALSGATTPHFSSTESAAKQALGAQIPRVWLVTLGRDRTRVDAPGELFASWLEQTYRLVESRGYAAEDERYRLLKEALLRRPDYAYKAQVRLYERR